MALPSWLSITPTTGSGSSSVKLSATEHTGRLDRSYAATVKTTTGSPQKTAQINVTQAAKAEFISVDPIDVKPANQPASYLITGKSNAEKITIIVNPTADSVLRNMTPKKYSVNGNIYSSGEAITDDPGATAEYVWNMSMDLPVNTSVNQQTYSFNIKTPGSELVTVTVKQAGAAPTLSLGASTATIPQAGGETSIQITSNAAWSVS